MRVAVKEPTAERSLSGLSSSSTLVTKITLPEIELMDSNLPLNITVPISRQQVPIGNSASPEKLTRSLVVRDHAAGTGVATGLSSSPVSRSRNDPEPLALESKIKFFLTPARMKVTRQRPARFVSDEPGAGAGACAAC